MAKRDARERKRSDKQKAMSKLIEADAHRRVISTAGGEASDRWLSSLGLVPVSRWHVEIAMTAKNLARFELSIYEEEWGFAFHHNEQSSWIRITDIPFVHGRDELRLLARTPDLLAINLFTAELEAEYAIAFDRAKATIRTNLRDASEVVRDWLLQPPPFSTVKKTVELCDNEMHQGIRCTKPRGHDGEHEYVSVDARGQLLWK